jgi:hypothetical protein
MFKFIPTQKQRENLDYEQQLEIVLLQFLLKAWITVAKTPRNAWSNFTFGNHGEVLLVTTVPCIQTEVWEHIQRLCSCFCICWDWFQATYQLGML